MFLILSLNLFQFVEKLMLDEKSFLDKQLDGGIDLDGVCH
jgi:hypothetical protein